MNLRKKIWEFLDNILYSKTLIEDVTYTSKDNQVSVTYIAEDSELIININNNTLHLPFGSDSINSILQNNTLEFNELSEDNLQIPIIDVNNIKSTSILEMLNFDFNSFLDNSITPTDYKNLSVSALNKLLKHYEEVEDYQKCIEISNILNKKL